MRHRRFPHLTFAKLEEFRDFVDKQEAKLADSLLLATIPAISSKGNIAPLHLHGSGHFRLSQALQVMSGRIRDLHEGEVSLGEWHSAVGIINQAFWNYVEVLEGASIELFDHINEIDLSGWSEDFFKVVASFKELLAHRIEDLVWVYRRVENLLFDYRSIAAHRKNLWMIFGKIICRFSSVLDKSILHHLFASEELLSTRYKVFSVSFEALKKDLPEIQEKESRFESFSMFPSLEDDEKHLIIKLYRLVALSEKNGRNGDLNQELIVTSIKNLAKPGALSIVFRDYLNEIKRSFFYLALSFQKEQDPTIKSWVKDQEVELDNLKMLIGSYREILLRADSDSYSKTRWKFTQWIVGPEPRKTRDFLNLLYQIDRLKKLFSSLYLSIEKGRSDDWPMKRNHLKRQIEDVLHEMGQPLSSRHLIQVKVERLIELLDVADELGGSLGDVRDLVNETMLKALHHDEKYQVLYDYPRFDELYAIHEGMCPVIQDQDHLERLKLFHSVTRHIETWLKKNSVQEHRQEIEIEESSIQESFQNFFAVVQRKKSSDIEASRYLHMCLEYRYLFSRFFHNLRSYEKDGKAVRSQFSFVDHYLESIESHLRNQEDVDFL